MALDHVTLPVRDYSVSKAFYERALRPLGLVLLLDAPDLRRAWFGFKGKPSLLWLRESPAAGSLELSLGAEHPETVDDFHAAALTAGARTEWEPGTRSEFSSDYYAARVLDPDGNSIEAVHRGAVAAGAIRRSEAA